MSRALIKEARKNAELFGDCSAGRLYGHLADVLERALQEKESAEAELVEFRDICQEFVDRVEREEVRSKHTYGRMKAALREKQDD